jgi:hypothetical protein
VDTGPALFERLFEIAHVDPAAAHWASHEVLALVDYPLEGDESGCIVRRQRFSIGHGQELS